jgi:hypothetical protein
VGDGRTNTLAKKPLYTFTSKNGANHFVPVVKTYTRTATDPRKNRTPDTAPTTDPAVAATAVPAVISVTTRDETSTILEAAMMALQPPANTLHQFEIVLNQEQTTGVQQTEYLIDLSGVPELIPLSTLPDEGYSTAGSSSGRSSPASSDGGDLITLQPMEVEVATAEPVQPTSSCTDLLHEIDISNIDTILAEEIDFDLLDNYTEESSLQTQELNIVGTFECFSDMVKALEPAKPKKRHMKGSKPQPLHKLPKENISNVLRCREYRKNKNARAYEELDELSALVARNEELKRQEEEMLAKLARVRGAYLKLITEGRVKYT